MKNREIYTDYQNVYKAMSGEEARRLEEHMENAKYRQAGSSLRK